MAAIIFACDMPGACDSTVTDWHRVHLGGTESLVWTRKPLWVTLPMEEAQISVISPAKTKEFRLNCRKTPCGKQVVLEQQWERPEGCSSPRVSLKVCSDLVSPRRD